MGVILAVAGIALGGSLAVLLASDMALFTLQWLVFATQKEVSLGVIKLFGIQNHDAGITPLVVCMTTATGLWLEPSVKPCLIAHVGPHILVAVHAQARLRLAIELDVTLSAVVFQLDVRLYHFSGRQNGLDPLSHSAGWHDTTPTKRDDKESNAPTKN